MNYLKNRYLLVRSVEETIEILKPGSVLTMTIARWPSGGFSVTSVIEELSEDIEKKTPTSS